MVKHYTKTKIVATIGPASKDQKTLEKLIKSGMRVARLNFSHGNYTDHKKLVKSIRSAAKNTGIEVAILQDLQGPRIRVGDVPPEGVPVKKGSKIALVGQSSHQVAVSGHITIPIQYDELYKDVSVGTLILIEDGTIQLKVSQIKNRTIFCKVKVAGTIKTHKGINVPGVTLSVDVITDKDKKDIEFGQKQDVDYVALSFVKDAGDIKRLKKLIAKHQPAKNKISTKTIAKIERQEALDNFAGILKEVDGIMVARGDLGIEVAAERVPLYQKQMIEHCLAAAKPVIVATQMLDSMIGNPQPTRAEVSDVANAVIDHTDGIMLSGESAAGKYPVEAVSMMTRIAGVTEGSHYDDFLCGPFDVEGRRHHALAAMVCHLHHDTQAKAALIFTNSGESARLIARHRPEFPIICLTKEPKTQRQLALVWGVISHLVPATVNERSLLKRGIDVIKQLGIAKDGDQIVIGGSMPFGKVPEMNHVRVMKIGEKY